MKVKYNPNKGNVKITISKDAALILSRMLSDPSFIALRENEYDCITAKGNHEISSLNFKLYEILD